MKQDVDMRHRLLGGGDPAVGCATWCALTHHDAATKTGVRPATKCCRHEGIGVCHFNLSRSHMAAHYNSNCLSVAD